MSHSARIQKIPQRLVVAESRFSSTVVEDRVSYHVTYNTPPTPVALSEVPYSDTLNRLMAKGGAPTPEIEDPLVAQFVERIHASPLLGNISIGPRAVTVGLEKEAFDQWPQHSGEVREPLSGLILERFVGVEEVVFNSL